VGLAKDVIPIRVYGQMLGVQTAFPAWKLDSHALADALNVRVSQGQVRTPNADDDLLGAAFNGATAIDGSFVGVRSDGTEDVIVATNGGIWSVTGESAELISKADPSGAIQAIVGTGVTADGDARFLANVASGDKFYLTADGISAATEISAVTDNAHLVLSESYKGAGTSGAYVIWRVQTAARTRIRQWLGNYFFANGTDPFRMYNPATDEFRDVGFDAATAPTSISSVSGGNLNTTGSYSYKFCHKDINGDYGNPSSAITGSVTGTDASFLFGGFANVPSWVTHFDVYRTEGQTAASALSSATHYYLTTIATSASEWTDTLADSELDTTLSPPADNVKPPSGIEDFEIHNDRIFAAVGSRVYIFGLDPDDDHTSTVGRWEPHYAPRSTYVGRDEAKAPECRGIFELHESLYILYSNSLNRLWDESDLPDAWKFLPYAKNLGSESRWSVAVDGNAAYWLGRRGGRISVFQFGGMQPTPIGRSVEPTLAAIAQATLETACGGCGDGYYWLSFNQGSGTKTMEYNTDRGDGRGAWMFRDWQAVAYAQGATVSYYGTTAGRVKAIGQGIAGALTAQFDTAAFQLEPEHPNDWMHVITEWASTSGAVISGWCNLLEGDGWTPISGYPITVASGGEYEIHRKGIQMSHPTRRCQLRFKSEGDEWVFGGLVINATQEPQEVSS